MKPLNRDSNEGCIKSASTCIVWSGKDLTCLGICNGDCLDKVIYEMATQICFLLDQLSVTEYDLSCFNLQNCAPKDFIGLLQLIINKICALEGVSNPQTSSTITPSGLPGASGRFGGFDSPIVNIAPCFYFNDPNTGDQVVTLPLTNYITLIGNTFCELLAANGQTVTGLQQQAGRIGTLERTVSALQNAPVLLPTITPACVLPSTSTPINIVLQALEAQFCAVVGALGSPNNLFSAIASQPANLNIANALGAQGGRMDSIPGWVPSVSNISDSLNNLWLTVADLRSAVTNIQLNCCPTACSGVAVSLQATLPSENTLVLFFTGAVPQGLLECNNAGTLFTIADQSGHILNVTIPVFTNMNNPSGFPININGTPLNSADNFTITADICFKNNTTGTNCQSSLEYVFVNTLHCPIVTFISGLTDIEFTFVHSSGTKTYNVSLYDSTGNTVLQSQTFPEGNPTTVTGTFSGLTEGTIYKVRLFITGANNLVTTCPFLSVSTLPNPCPPPAGVGAVIIIN